MTQNLRELSTAPERVEPTETSKNFAIWGYICGFVGTVFFSMKAIFIKLAYQPVAGLEENAIDAITLMSLRLGIAGPVYVAILLGLLRKAHLQGDPIPPLKDFLLAALLGVMGYYVCAWLDIEGLKYITAQLERLLLFTYPIFVFILGAMFFGKPLTRWAIVAIILSYAGIAVIFLGGDIAVGLNVPLGASMILACALAFALFQLLAKPMIKRLGSLMFTCAAMLGAGVVILIHFVVENTLAGTLTTVFDMPPRIYMIGFALAVLCTLVPSFLVNVGISRIGPQAVAALGMASPLIVVVMAIIWLGEPFGWMDALGTALTLVGIGLYTWSDLRSQRVQNQPKSVTPLQR